MASKDLRKNPIMSDGYDMDTGASCGAGADSGSKTTFKPMAPSMSESEAGAISIPQFEPTEFTTN
jgi:hypothetical protein